MDLLKIILDEDDIENIYETFNQNTILQLDKQNIEKILDYLKQNNITVIYNILTEYTDLLILDVSNFIKRFEKLKKSFTNLNEALEYNITILELMY